MICTLNAVITLSIPLYNAQFFRNIIELLSDLFVANNGCKNGDGQILNSNVLTDTTFTRLIFWLGLGLCAFCILHV